MSAIVEPSKALVRVQPKGGRARYVAGQAASKVSYQAAKTPAYTFRVAKYSAWGLAISVPAVLRFVWTGDIREEIKLARQAGKVELAAKRRDAWHWHFWPKLLGIGFGSTVLVRLVEQRVGTVGLIGLGLCLAVTLAVIGSRDRGTTITDKTPPRRGDITQERLDDALRAIGLLNKPKADGTGVGLNVLMHGMPHVRNGGVFITFDLPAGAKATAHMVAQNKALLAGQLGVLDRMLVIKQGDSEAQVELWVAHEDPLRAGIVQSPYVEAKRASVWDGIRIGADPMGDAIIIETLRNSIGLGGLPQVGKSSVSRVIASAYALDPYADAVVLDGKGGADWSDMEPLAARYVNGTSETAVAQMLGTVKDLVRQMDGRYEIILKAGKVLAPDNRITRELAEQHNLRPCLVLLDELQDILGALGSKSTEMLEALTRLARRGPAAGISVLTVAHRPDASSVAKSLTGAQSIKIACRTDDRTASDLILGEGANKSGWNASRLPEVDGVGIVRTQRFTTEAKFDFVSPTEFEAICDRGMRLRAAAGTLREAADKGTETLLDRVIEVLQAEDKLTAAQIIERLSLELSPTSFGMRMRTFGLSSVKGASGERLFHLQDALSSLG